MGGGKRRAGVGAALAVASQFLPEISLLFRAAALLTGRSPSSLEIT